MRCNSDSVKRKIRHVVSVECCHLIIHILKTDLSKGIITPKTYA